ncbi:MAG: PAS domain S-box protein [Spirochaetales bacterium]|nr:PAS domain S-box protein [Spirochaetales bacterium]
MAYLVAMTSLLTDTRPQSFLLRILAVLLYIEAVLSLAALFLGKTSSWSTHLVVLFLLGTLWGLRIDRWSLKKAATALIALGWLATLAFAFWGSAIGWWAWCLLLPLLATFTLPWGWTLVLTGFLDASNVALLLGKGHAWVPVPGFLTPDPGQLGKIWLLFFGLQGSLLGLAFLVRKRQTFREIIEHQSVEEVQINLLETLIDLIPIPIFYKDENGRFISGNVAFSVVFDVRKDNLSGKTNKEVLPPPNAQVFEEVELEVLSRESMAAEEVTLVHADGSPHAFIIYLLRFQAPKSPEAGFLGVLIDITSRKAREQTLESLNATKDRLFSIISHDLRGPVGKIQQLLDIWVDDRTLFDEKTWGEVFKDMRLSTHSLLHLLENLLSWARTQKGDYVPRPESFPFDPMVTEVFQLFQLIAQEKGVKLVPQITLSTQVHTDKTMLSTILRNLVHNAIKFTRTGGTVTVSAQETPAGVEIKVADTGVGMSQDTLALLKSRTEPFTTLGTAKERGQGLGLSVCFDMAKVLEAQLEVTSTVGKGTIFRLVLTVPELEFLSDE